MQLVVFLYAKKGVLNLGSKLYIKCARFFRAFVNDLQLPLSNFGKRPRVPNLQPFIPKKNAKQKQEEQKEPAQMETSLKPS